MDKTKEIERWLLDDLFPQIGINKPSNFDTIVAFIKEDVEATADVKEYHSGDFSISFRRFLEHKSE